MKGIIKVKLIVGLGNPGIEYKETRHNVGFLTIDALMTKLAIKFNYKWKLSTFTKIIKNNETIVFLKPQTYMNLSGTSVLEVADYLKIDYQDIIMIYDDLDLDLGTIKLKPAGNSGGHNGVNSIIKQLNTNKIKRIKIGIGRNSKHETSAWVLGKFMNDEKIIIEQTIAKVVTIIEDFLGDFNFERLMNQYN